MNRDPIFFAITRSFLLGWLPALLTLIDVAVQIADVLFQSAGDPQMAMPVATLIARFVPGDVPPEQIVTVMRAVAPLYALIVAQQRAGRADRAPRPYTLDPRAIK